MLTCSSEKGFEFKLAKAQFNQPSIEFWGCVLDGQGRRVQPRKVEQLEKWPEPREASDVNSFLCFVNYLREYLPPEWVSWEQVLKPFRKKGCDFRIWAADPCYREAFLKIRGALCRDVVLRHVDFVAAADPAASGRPLEMFVDASDYAWAATLCQRPEPMAAPKIIAITAKGFADVQQRWSAMERELYALWQGVVGHERMIKGFRCYCYIDHKNNVFSDAQLDNRRRSKKMSNWALELQGFDIVRVWIRGEANILADAPSRAPWESRLAQYLPIPDLPVRELVKKMYQDPEGLEVLVSERRERMLGPEGEWQPIPREKPEAVLAEDGVVEGEIPSEDTRGRTPRLAGTRDEGYQTPTFGRERGPALDRACAGASPLRAGPGVALLPLVRA